jgi:hypothetical protein
MLATSPTHHILLDLIIIKIFGEEIRQYASMVGIDRRRNEERKRTGNEYESSSHSTAAYVSMNSLPSVISTRYPCEILR